MLDLRIALGGTPTALRGRVIFPMERDFLRRLIPRLPGHKRLLLGPGDDAALLALARDNACVVTTDMLMDGVDFELGKCDIKRVGRKSLAANLSDLAAMAADGLTVAALPASGGSTAPSREVRVIVTGLDHPGIVSHIASAVARAGLNVEEFTSEVTSAPMSGEPLFTAVIRLTGPPTVDLPDLTSALETLSEELMVEISLTEK